MSFHAGITAQEIKTNGYTSWLSKLEWFLKETLGRRLDRQSFTKTPHAVQFKYNGMIDVDLLLSPFWNDHYEVYDFLKSVPEAKRFRWVITINYVCKILNLCIKCC